MTSSRFILGVDLGTTNSAVACVDLQSASQQVDSFAIPQLVARGQVSPRKQLPSFIYIPGVHDLTGLTVRLLGVAHLNFSWVIWPEPKGRECPRE